MNFQSGDVVERPGTAGTKHRAVVAGVDGSGRLLVIHNAKSLYVKYDLLDVFAAGFPVSLISRVASNWFEQQQIVERAKSLLGKQYDLINFNCDHLVTYAQSGEATSPQLQAVVAVLALASVFGGLVFASSRG